MYNLIEMKGDITKEKYITPIGTDFLDTIVPKLMKKSFNAYIKRDFSKDFFQVSICERSHAAAAIALTTSAIEAHRNRIYYMHKMDISKSVASDIAHLPNGTNFPRNLYQQIINEVFVLRDVILHSHMYELDVQVKSDSWDMIGLTSEMQLGYGDNKFNQLVDMHKLFTKYLELRVLPTKIGFEELFIVLLVFDLFSGVTDNTFKYNSVPYHLNFKVDNIWLINMNELLTHYFDELPNNTFVNRINHIANAFRKEFATFIDRHHKWDYFITNICPKCNLLGFKKSSRIYKCRGCNSYIGIEPK